MGSTVETLVTARQLQQAGDLPGAEEVYRRALAADGTSAEVWRHLASVCQAQGKHADAVAGYRRAIEIKPDLAEAHNSLGIILAQQRRVAEAEICFRRAILAKPHFAQAHNNLGNVLKEQRQHSLAEACYRRAVQLEEDFAEAHNNLGSLLRERGQLADAAAACARAVALMPKLAAAHNNLGAVLASLKQWDVAGACFRQAIALEPLFAEAHSNLGNALREVGRTDEALLSLHEAVALQPGFAAAHRELGLALMDQGNLDGAAASCRQALQLKPDLVAGYVSLGFILSELGERSQALDCYRRALELNPELTEAKRNRSLVRLLQGEFTEAWPEYELRWGTESLPRRPFPQPEWDGSPLEGRSILVHAEQGLGDTLQFARYLPLVKQRGGTVIFVCQKPLAALLTGLAGVDRLVAQGDPLPEFDLHAPLLSLPRIFDTRVNNIPGEVPYLHANQPLVEHWGKELGAISGLRIGIAWQGSKNYRLDRYRSVPLAHFESLARVPGVQLISLQKGLGTEQLRDLTGRFSVVDLGGSLDTTNGAFMDTAAVMKNLDLVVTSDTAIVHLAGALGVPTWLALPFVPDWRWLLERDDSPWYPSVRLFRQQRRGEWEALFARMADALRTQGEGRAPPPPVVADNAATTLPGKSEPALVNRVKPCRYGRMLYQANDVYIGRSLHLYGEYCEAEVALFRRLVKPGQTVLDVGANIGAHTVALARLVGPSGRVLAFEPQRLAFYCLCGNVAQNDLHHAVCHQAALGKAPGRICVPQINHDSVNNFGGIDLSRDYSNVPSYSVPVMTVDGLGLTACDFIKIDVEGMESEVLEGARTTIQRFKPLLYVEDDRTEKSAALHALLETLGYDAYRHRAPYYNRDNFAHNGQNVFENLVALNLYCHHRSRSSPIEPGRYGMSNGAEASGTGSSPTKESGAPDLLDQARRLHKQGDFESAAALYREVVAADPGRAHAWYLLGVCCQSLGHHEEAEASLRQATERQPGHPETHNQLGVVLALQDRLEEALVCFRRALALKPDDPAIGNNLGRALLRQEKDADPKQGLEGVVSVDLSPGELIDKITILEIKNERIGDPAKLRNVRTELAGLRDARARAVNSSPELASLEAALRAVNESLWEIEERIRAHEKNHDFGAAFVALARSVYRENDRRAALKRKLNDLLGARVVEEKSY